MVFRKAGLAAGAGMAVILAALLTGCGGDNSIGPSANATSRVRVFNALGNNSGSIDVLTSSNSVALNASGGVAYGTASNYQLVRAGNDVNAAAYPTGTTTTPLATNSSIGNLNSHTAGQNDGTETVIVAGVVGQAANTGFGPQILRFIDEPNPPTDQAQIRVINLVPATGSLVLYNGSVVVPGLPTNGVTYGSGTGYANVSLVGGQNFSLNAYVGSQALLTTPVAVTLQPGYAYTVFVFGGGVSGQPVNMVVIQDAPITNPA